MEEIKEIDEKDLRELLSQKKYKELRETLSEMNTADIAAIMDEMEDEDSLRIFRILLTMRLTCWKKCRQM